MRNNVLIVCLISLLSLLIIIANSLFIVYEHQQAIVTQFGKVVSKKVLKSGLHFKIPMIQKVLIFERRIMNLEPEAREVIAMDQKRVIVDSYVKYVINDPLKFYQTVAVESNLGMRVNPIVESRIREEIGKVSLLNLISSNRAITMDLIKKNLDKQVKNYGISIMDFRIKRTDLPATNSESIFRRMEADRKKEALEIRAQGEARSNIIKATADKERIVLLSEAEEKSSILRGQAQAEMMKAYNEIYSKDRDFFIFMKYMETYENSFNKENTYFMLKNDKKNSFMKLFNGE